MVGGCSTGIDFVLYMLISLKLPITISKGISMIVSSIFSYYANKNYTFGNKEKTNVGYFIRFYLVFAANFGTNLGVNYLIYHSTGYKLIAYVMATACGLTVNYLGQRFFVFSKKGFKK
jgi:putative flippase GtrA